ncbi:hypothetical protein SAY86_003195 [Trapa natans]|uniref:DUF4378 domain-containing protein n=1 Tax=Trapa natans TaxID=22666 RepID=A0AAN7LHJ4_TRANT|nr:hypothetical protein SAY86_003195 [Trapa natans]
MMTGMVQDQNLEKQIERHMGGCMAGFLHIFDRHHQPIPAKRLISSNTKRFPPSSTVSPTRDDADSSAGPPPATPEHHSTAFSLRGTRSPAPEPVTPSEASSARSPLPFPIFELKEGTRSPWRFSKEVPRLSLDSRAVTDARGGLYPREIRTNTVADRPDDGDAPAAADEDGQQRRSPSVIARLMGLENLPRASPEPTKNAELRRSASESRVNKDLYRFLEGSHFVQNHQQQPAMVLSNVIREGMVVPGDAKSNKIGAEQAVKMTAHRHQRGPGGMGRRKSFYDSTDFFPEPAKQSASSIYEEIERRLRMRGIDEPPKDLETLKQILDAHQLKGLLHSKRDIVGANAFPIPHYHTNFVYEKSFEDDSSPVIHMKPSRAGINRFSIRNESESSSLSSFRPSRPMAARRSSPTRDVFPVAVASPRRENVRGQSGGGGRASATLSPTRSDTGGVNSPGRRRSTVMNVERKRAPSPVQTKIDPSRQHRSSLTFTSRMQSLQKPVTEVYPAEDESSTLSESSVSTPSQTDTERIKVEECRDGRSLLERCDKLLHSIAEMTAASDLQPSPVSVLDAASFYKDESSPSPVMKRRIDFKEQSGELDDDLWSLISFKRNEKDDLDDANFVYISDILRASSCLPEDSDVFLLLEKQQYLKGKDTSKASRMHRQLVFDAVTEILERKRRFPQLGTKNPMAASLDRPSVQQVWWEFQQIRGREAAEEDLFEVICGVLRKDLTMGDAVTGWGGCHIEVSESVLDIERLIFKDLVSETIRDLATSFAPEYASRDQLPCRRLVF